MMGINYIDAFVILALVYSFYKGFAKGFIIVFASLVALVTGIIGAIYFSDHIAHILVVKTNIREEYLSITAFTLTFIVIILGVQLVARIVDQAVKIMALGPLNKIMGGVFATLKTTLILIIMFYLFDFLNSNWNMINQSTLNQSISYPTMVRTSEKLISYLTSTSWYKPNKLEKIMDEVKTTIEEERSKTQNKKDKNLNSSIPHQTLF